MEETHDPFVFIVNKNTDWETPYKIQAEIGTNRVSNLIKQEQKEVKKERIIQPPNAPILENSIKKEKMEPSKFVEKTNENSSVMNSNMIKSEKIDYNMYSSKIHQYRLRGPNKHLFISYYTLFVKPIYEVHQKQNKSKEMNNTQQYIKEVSNAYGMDQTKCTQMISTINRWFYQNGNVNKTSDSILQRASEPFLRNSMEKGIGYSQQKDPIANIPMTYTDAMKNNNPRQQMPQQGYYNDGYNYSNYRDQRRYDMYDDPRNDPRYPPMNYPSRFDDNFNMGYYPPPYYNARNDYYDMYSRYDAYDTRSPRDLRNDPRMEPRVEPRMPYDKAMDMGRMNRMNPNDRERNMDVNKNDGKERANNDNQRPNDRNPRMSLQEARPPLLNDVRDMRDYRNEPRDMRDYRNDGRYMDQPRYDDRYDFRYMRDMRDMRYDMQDYRRDFPRDMRNDPRMDMRGPPPMDRGDPRGPPPPMDRGDPRMMDRGDSRMMDRDPRSILGGGLNIPVNDRDNRMDRSDPEKRRNYPQPPYNK